ncbi:hypothetical protein J6590_041839 [Homalodisca vitripennis]|nr:hypothetical protein J6590_041839 [Homalodisca vitripennis]
MSTLGRYERGRVFTCLFLCMSICLPTYACLANRKRQRTMLTARRTKKAMAARGRSSCLYSRVDVGPPPTSTILNQRWRPVGGGKSHQRHGLSDFNMLA